ncbi:hypothetical protein PVAND_010781 [Polypedilum vanderplanki]|uniref:Uncharacterized protein n=1 Tax=Polypedilum vanderplanki TaxID=319348 RepID=A0A9J6CHJ9_POLVA|nr:hypothetical protein PVAND_010781 [Polypedilum vanderplanki]
MQIVEIRGDLMNSVSMSLKHNVYYDANQLMKIRNEYFNIFEDFVAYIKSSKSLTYLANEAINAISEELKRHKKLCVKYMNNDYYLAWYRSLKLYIEKTFVPKIEQSIESFLTTLTGKKVVRCWLAGKNPAKECFLLNLTTHAYWNTTKFIVANYTTYLNKIKSLSDDARKNITEANSASYFLTNNNATIWKFMTEFINAVEYFSNNQTNATFEVLNSTFNILLPKCEVILANITECINTKVTKTPKVPKGG